jgi:hypothetical protein
VRAISFSFKKEAPEAERQSALHEIRQMEGVGGASLVLPTAKNEALRCMATVSLDQAAQPEKVLQKLRGNPHIAQASIPAERYLADNEGH